MFTPIILIFIFLVLILLMTLRNKWILNEPNRVGCSVTEFGCCPDNLTPKLSRLGENCLQKTYPPTYQTQVIGCSGTPYGCCPDGITIANETHSNCYITPIRPINPINPPPPQPIGGCAGTIYGCCSDGVTPAYDQFGTNCSSVPNQRNIGGCSGTRYGCCGDGVTAADQHHSNCLYNINS
jgi:hypothetical protein